MVLFGCPALALFFKQFTHEDALIEKGKYFVDIKTFRGKDLHARRAGGNHPPGHGSIYSW